MCIVRVPVGKTDRALEVDRYISTGRDFYLLNYCREKWLCTCSADHAHLGVVTGM